MQIRFESSDIPGVKVTVEVEGADDPYRNALTQLIQRFTEERQLEHWRKEDGETALHFAEKWAQEALKNAGRG